MKSIGIKAIFSATVYLLLYCVLLQFDSAAAIAFFMLLLSPIVVCWMVYMVLKHDRYNGPELGDDEFGYQDKPKDQLGVF